MRWVDWSLRQQFSRDVWFCWVQIPNELFLYAVCVLFIGDFLIVGEGDGGEATTATGKKGAVTSIVVHILYKEQIKNLKQKDLWCSVAGVKLRWLSVLEPYSVVECPLLLF